MSDEISDRSPAVQLADEFVAHRSATDQLWALWAGDLEHLERWDDVSAEGLATRTGELRDFERRAEALKPTNDPDRLLVETVGYTARSERHQLVWREELEWVNHATGPIPSILTFLPRYPLLTAEHGERYHDKLHALSTFVDQWRSRLDRAAGERRAPIAHLVASAIAMLDRQLTSPLSSGPLGEQSPPREIGGDAAKEWRTRTHQLLDDEVTAALRRLRSTLAEAMQPVTRSDDQPGLVHVPGGGDHYERLVWAHTTLDVTAQEVHDIGLAQIARLEEEYVEMTGPLFDSDEVGAIYHRLRDDEALHYHDAPTIVADATRALAKAEAAMPRWFGRLPLAPCVATSIDQGALAFYSSPARDGSKPGTFFFNTADPSMWGTYQLEAVTYHESIPGHHLQFSIAQELEAEGLHPLLSRYYITAYGEGWGLYTERLADEMDLYSSALDRVGMLSADSMRACRLVVDTGMHALGWSRDRAIAFMLDHSPLSHRQVVNEIDRYIGNPGQALSYMIGRLEIERIRADAAARLGQRFDIRGFHDVVLGSGSITLPSLHRLVEAWDPT